MLFEESDYKSAIRSRIRELKQAGAPVSMKQLAEEIRVQYTYLSKVMNQDKAHLNQDQLFKIAKLLKLGPVETEYVLLLRDRDVAATEELRSWLNSRILMSRDVQSLRDDIKVVRTDEFHTQLAHYLIDPLAVLVHVGVQIDRFQTRPMLLAQILQTSTETLADKLRLLEASGMIAMDWDAVKVTSISHPSIHFQPEHPLIRSHQAFLKQLGAGRLLMTDERLKKSFVTVFNGDRSAFERVLRAFQRFIVEVQAISSESECSERIHQLSFDFFVWND